MSVLLINATTTINTTTILLQKFLLQLLQILLLSSTTSIKRTNKEYKNDSVSNNITEIKISQANMQKIEFHYIYFFF